MFPWGTICAPCWSNNVIGAPAAPPIDCLIDACIQEKARRLQ
jgi:hypothetical protein